jgi:hypothetical protein
MARPTVAVRAVSAAVLLGAVLSACAGPTVPQGAAAGSVQSTTAAANAPHPLTTVPGVRVGVQITAVATPTAKPVPTVLATLPVPRAAGTLLPAKPHPSPVKVTSVDGCNRAYGTASQCVPLLAPGGKAVTCAYLKSSGLFARPLVVVDDPWGLLKKKNARTGTTPDGRFKTIAGCTD